MAIYNQYTQIFSWKNQSKIANFYVEPPEDKIIVAGGKQIKVSDLKTGKVAEVKSQDEKIVCFQAFKNKMFTGSKNGKINIWEYGKETPIHTFKAHERKITCIHIYDEHTVLSSSKDGTIKVWDTSNTQEALKVFEEEEIVNHITVDNKTLVSAHKEGIIITRPIVGGGEEYVLPEGHTGDIIATAIKGSVIASCGSDYRLKFWNPLKPVKQQCLQTIETLQPFKTLHLKEGDLFSGHLNSIKHYDFQNRKCVGSINLSETYHSEEETVVALQYEGEKLYSGSKEGTLRIFDIKKA